VHDLLLIRTSGYVAFDHHGVPVEISASLRVVWNFKKVTVGQFVLPGPSPGTRISAVSEFLNPLLSASSCCVGRYRWSSHKVIEKLLGIPNFFPNAPTKRLWEGQRTTYTSSALFTSTRRSAFCCGIACPCRSRRKSSTHWLCLFNTAATCLQKMS